MSGERDELSKRDELSIGEDDVLQLRRDAAAAVADNEHTRAIGLYTRLLTITSPRASDLVTADIRLEALRERGRLFNLLGEPQAALAAYEQYYVEAGDSRHAVDALVAIGNQCTYMNLTDRALEAQRDALRLAESLGYTSGRAMALGGIGLVYNYLDRSEEALTYLHKALTLFDQLGDRAEQARGWNRIGVAHVRLGQLDKAILAFRSSSELAHDVGDSGPVVQEMAVISLNNLGECYQNLFDMEQALATHRKGLSMAQTTDLPYLEADLARNLGVDLRFLGLIEEGIEYLHRSLELSLETNQPDVEVQAMYSLAMAELQRGNWIEARAMAERLQAKAEPNNNKGSLAEALHALGHAQRQMGDLSAAQGCWQQALFLAHETGRRMLLWRLHAALAEVAGGQELAGVHNQIAAEIIRQIANPIEDLELRQKFLEAKPVSAVLNQSAGGWGRLSQSEDSPGPIS
ncbi:MAG TPA: tetratricopeptide repeat protein [Anaerolineae bacterium]|jgi:tetratricopeptide (TPR) repeat protein|nr:tetratricopeptide repeat protein [Anaerolineae bacterium]